MGVTVAAWVTGVGVTLGVEEMGVWVSKAAGMRVSAAASPVGR